MAAPVRLRERVNWYVAEAAPSGDIPAVLAAAGQRALAEAARHEGDRGAALDLLAADALITLALLAQAERDPAMLHRFASGLVTPGTATA